MESDLMLRSPKDALQVAVTLVTAMNNQPQDHELAHNTVKSLIADGYHAGDMVVALTRLVVLLLEMYKENTEAARDMNITDILRNIALAIEENEPDA